MKRNGYTYSNTGKKLGVRWDRYNWKFERTIWADDNCGKQFIRVNGIFWDIDEVRSQCDDWYIAY